MNKKLMGITGLIGLAIILAGCGGAALNESSSQAENDAQVIRSAEETKANEAVAAADTASEVGEVTGPSPSLIPQEAPPFEHELADGEYSWRQLLPRDGIFPIYEPELEFAGAENAPYSDDELVIGIEINGQARAYAIGPLNGREMVNDTVGGVPILVTW